MTQNDKVPSYVKGQKLFVTLSDNRNLEGSYSRSSSVRKAIVLHDVSFVPFDGKSFTQLEFKFSEILKIDSLEEGGESTENNTTNHSTVPSPSVPLKKQDGVLYEAVKKIVQNHLFVDQVDEKFSEAVKVLSKVDYIAVTGQNSDQGRFGHMTILGFATHSCVVLFDIVNLGSRAFVEHGSFLKKFLESTRVLKIVHNCRLLSDCLKHKYSVTLRNIFDTQACHIIVVKNRSGHPPSTATLSNLISEYLNLPDGLVQTQFTNPEMWRRRPLEEGMAEAVAWRVAVIRKLKQPMDDAIYAPFDSLCQYYLSAVRDLDDELDAHIEVKQQDKLPNQVTASDK